MQADLAGKRELMTQNDDAQTEIDIGDDDNDLRSFYHKLLAFTN